MDTEMLTGIVSLLNILSIASERLVQIVKRLVPFLNVKTKGNAESQRKACLHGLAILAGIATAYLSSDIITKSSNLMLNDPVTVIGMGLLVSGGSDFWNSILGYLNGLKKAKQVVSD